LFLPLLLVDPVAGCSPAFELVLRPGLWIVGLAGFGLLKDRLECQRGKRGDQDRALAGFHDAGIPVIDGTVEEDLRPAPGAAVVVGPEDLDPAERAHMGFPSAGADQEQLAVTPPGEGRPTVVMLR